MLSRIMSTKLVQELGRPVTIENRSGANGIVGTEAVANSAPDGYALLLGSSSQFAINPVTHSKLPYDPIKS